MSHGVATRPVPRQLWVILFKKYFRTDFFLLPLICALAIATRLAFVSADGLRRRLSASAADGSNEYSLNQYIAAAAAAAAGSPRTRDGRWLEWLVGVERRPTDTKPNRRLYRRRRRRRTNVLRGAGEFQAAQFDFRRRFVYTSVGVGSGRRRRRRRTGMRARRHDRSMRLRSTIDGRRD